MSKVKGKEFTVTARVISIVETTIIGCKTMQEALEFARGLQSEEFVNINDDCYGADDSVEITGISGARHYET